LLPTLPTNVLWPVFSSKRGHGKVKDRDRHIGWNVEQSMQRRHFVVQNSRFLILSNQKRRNLASRVMSVCARQV